MYIAKGELTDQVLSVRVRVMKRALPSLLSPSPDSTMSITSFTTGSFRFMPRVAATRGSRLKSFMVVAKKSEVQMVHETRVNCIGLGLCLESRWDDPVEGG